MTKDECRKLFSEKRKKLSDTDLKSASEKIILQLLNHVNLTGKTVSLFLPILAKREIDTFPLLERRNELAARFAFPVADFASGTMRHLEYEADQQLALNNYGIPEPANGRTVTAAEIDIVIVPLLCFDLKGYRVGYGKGFYDRFLSSCRNDCQFIGLSVFGPVEAISDADEHDIPLHTCITPEKIYTF